MSENEYINLADELLDNLTDSLDEALYPWLDDVALDSGVLTVVMRDGKTFVINKQRPTK